MENHARGRVHSGGKGKGKGRRNDNQSYGENPPNYPLQQTKLVYRPIQARNTGVASEPPTSELPSQTSSPSPPPRVVERVPVIRPDKGGKSAMRSPRLLVNHFRVRFNPQLTIRHYDIDIQPEIPPKHGGTVQLPNSVMRMIMNKLFSDDPRRFPISMTAYDGKKNIFSAVELPTGTFKVEVFWEEGLKARTYLFTIKLAKKLELHRLAAYFNGTLPLLPREILQGMDVIMKEVPTRKRILINRSFYPKGFKKEDNIGSGLIVSKGFQHSLKPTSQGLALCVDYSVLAFRKPIPVLEFLREHLPWIYWRPFNYQVRKEVEKALKDLTVMVTHRTIKQKFTIMGLTELVSSKLKFTIEDPEGKKSPKEVGLVDYYRTRYEKEIRYDNIPCLDLSKNKKMNYVPMEFCVLVEGQRYSNDLLDKDWETAQKYKKLAMANPRKRMEAICNMVRAMDGPRGGEVAQNFEIVVSTEMTEVISRVIRPPVLKVGDSKGKLSKLTIDRDDCQWNLMDRSVVEGKRIDRWAILDFTSSDKNNLIPDHFAPKLIDRCGKLGIQMKAHLFCKSSTMNALSNVDQLLRLLVNVCNRAEQISGEQLQILVCVMSKRDPGYKNLKRISETEIGIMTQCCLGYHAIQADDRYLSNLALKINAKLGGSNIELFDRLPRLGGDSHVMFVGADVNHPASWNAYSPSFAAVVATMNWPAANRYVARIRPQEHRLEKIKAFGEMCLELVNTYARLNKVKPEKIVVFRDGVSESQFKMVLNEELIDLKNAIESDGYSPTITLVVAQKRHQTRFFPKDERQGARSGNVLPGTVVDTTIVHPREYDFYLNSHQGSLGTSKPTHYYVLWDEHEFTSDELQRVIYNLCYTFPRCTKPISLVPPVYYADIAAYRARQYHEALVESHSPAFTESSSSTYTLSPSSSSSSSIFDDIRFFKLHSNLENGMPFI